MIWLVLMAAMNCGSRATQMDLNACSAAQAQKAVAREARAFRNVLRRFPSSTDRARLLSSELAWKTYRRAACDYAGYIVRGGSIRPLVDNTCRQSLTTGRVADMQLFGGGFENRSQFPSAASAAEEARVYGKLKLLLAPGERTLLVRSEATWLAYRKLACARAAATCATELTQRRTVALKDSWIAEPFW